MGPLRIFIASADENLRLALLILLDQEPGMVVVGISDRWQGLLTQLEGSDPDALLLDWDIATQSTVKLLTDLHHVNCRVRSIVLSSRLKERDKVLVAGASGFISKDEPPDTLIPILNNIRYSLDK